MRKELLLSIIIAIAVLMTFSSCVGNPKTANGEDSGAVDEYVKTHYPESQVKGAIQREKEVQELVRPSDASSFGKKKAEVRWRALINDRTADHFVIEDGAVTVVHYEHGLEIIKDGASWYYDGFEYSENNIWNIGAGLSILHRPRWEPVNIIFSSTDLRFEYLYPVGHNNSEHFIIAESELYNLDINQRGDMLKYPNPITKF